MDANARSSNKRRRLSTLLEYGFRGVSFSQSEQNEFKKLIVWTISSLGLAFKAVDNWALRKLLALVRPACGKVISNLISVAVY